MTDEKQASEETKTVIEVKSDLTNAEQLEARDIKSRARLKVVTEELETIKAKNELEKKDLSSKIESASKEKQMLEKKLIDAELKAHAVAAGITDIDFVKLIDSSTLVLNAEGKVEGIDKALNDFKAAKPALFKAERKSSSSSNEKLPGSNDKTPTVDAFKLSDEDFQKQKYALLSGGLL